jgi:hypothetical protein
VADPADSGRRDRVDLRATDVMCPGVRRVNLALAAVLMACVLRLWIMPLESSFWVDEMGTSFVVRHGGADPSLQVAPQVPESIYYVLPEIATRLFGNSEFAYRLPSVLAMLLALWLIFRLAVRLIHPSAGWFVVFACLALGGFNYQAADARPYALGTCVFCLSMLFLLRWLDAGRWGDALIFALAASLLLRVQPVYWTAYVVFSAYTVMRLLRRDTPVTWRSAVLVFCGLGISLVPVALEAAALLKGASAHVIVPLPSGRDLGNSLKLGLVVAVCAGAACIARWRRWPAVEELPARDSLTTIGLWWLCPPLCLFAFSWLSGASLFVERYMSIALPGTALAAAAVAAVFIPPAYWKRLALVFGLGILVFLGHWNRLWPPHHGSDWRLAAVAVREQHLGAGVPILAPSPFIEAQPPVWRPNYPVNTFLYSNLLVYRVSGRVYPFPFRYSSEAAEYASQLAKSTLPAAGCFVLYGSTRSIGFWREWFEVRPEFAAWRIQDLGPFGDIDAIVFRKAMQTAAR